MKERSSREQIADFSIRRPRSAPILVSKLIDINAVLVDHVHVSERDKLFLANANSRPRVPCFQMLHNLLDEFIIRHELPAFDFKQLRRAGAALHLEASNDIQSPRTRLNHRSARTTIAYATTERLGQENDRLINRFQGELVRKSLTLGRTHAPRETSQVPSPSTKKSVDTVFGFGCKDPYAGALLHKSCGNQG
jgi:hypothetical protein